jgi:serine/threonine protein kinase/tetratricopeptide (TPR) repeat protein
MKLPFQLGRYTLNSILGEGGMARVYGATLEGPAGFRKEVALKVILNPDHRRDPETGGGLSREARLCGLLKHPNVVDVYDFGVADGSQYIAMEVVNGLSIRQLIRQLGPLPPSVCLEIVSCVCDGLLHAHGLMVESRNAGLVHRDLTPGNIMIDQTGVVKIMDFGLARTGPWNEQTVEDETLRGTPPFMSPEQLETGSTDHRSDLFSIGAIIYEMATGDRFFAGRTPIASLLKVQNVEKWVNDADHMKPVNAAIPGLAEVVRGCLRKNPEDRYADADALRGDIEALRRNMDPTPNLREFIGEILHGSETQLFELDQDATTRPTPEPTAIKISDTDSTTETILNKLVPRSNLGSERSQFIGRTLDIDRLEQLFDEGNRLITLTGPGGSGKTRLSLHFARKMLNRNLPGQELWWCELGAVQTCEGIAHGVASAMSLETSPQVTAEALIERIGQTLARSPDVLLVLDNFEQVADMAGATIGRWLDLTDNARFLVTSQTRLHLQGEVFHSLGPLDDPDAIHLFHQRAKQAGANLEQLTLDEGALIELIHRLDGLPLAIELAAGHAQIFPPPEILKRLSSRFHLLRRKGTDSPGRHRSLEAALDWSWSLLQPWEQSALAQLSVFSGGFTLEHAEQVVDLRAHVDAPWVVFVIESLMDRSLVYAQTTSDPSGQIRFGMTESVLEFSRAKLGSDETGACRRHGECFAQYGTIEYIESLRRKGGDKRRLALEADIANLTTAAERAIEQGWTEVATHTTQVSMVIYNTMGPLAGAVDLGQQVIQMRTLTEKQRCRMLLGLGWSMVYVQRDESADLLHQALSIAERLDDHWLTIVTLTNLGACWLQLGLPAKARESLERAVQVAKDRNMVETSITALVNLGMVCAEAGDNDKALKYYEKGRRIAEEIGNHRTQCQALMNLGDLYRTLGNPKKSREVTERALQIASSAGYVRMQCISLFNLAELEYEAGDLTAAIGLVDTGLSKLEIMGGNFKNMALMLAYRAMMKAQTGDIDDMHRDLARSRRVMDSASKRGAWHVQSLCYRGHAEVFSRDLDSARTSLQNAIELTRELGPNTVGRVAEQVDKLRDTIQSQSER